ncbi:hypothetical protein GGS20DRAFT_53924 [Poronia punctata]|nr:hypothetical protein GGS20DRAFT_53924 [Poronia punctata]
MRRTFTKQQPGTAEPPRLESYDLLDDLIDGYLDPTTTTVLVKTSSAVEVRELSDTPERKRQRQIQRQKSTPGLNTSESVTVLEPKSPISSSSSSSSRPTWKTVLDETIYFAGGLISRPFESTKHYSILRHSSAIVYYTGPSTSIAISIFADVALPTDRSFWIQRKGFSGNLGMAASALMRTTSNWIDVTPSVEASASSVPEREERAWQRDINKFLKKDKERHHVPRQTCVLRIPAEAADGYLRVVMCTGQQQKKKSLCPSPTFRLASTSSDVSVLRGASLTTLPLEIGLKAASVVGNQYVQRVVGPAQSTVGRIQPAFVKKNAGKVSFLREQAVQLELGRNFDPARDVTYDPFHQEEGELDELPAVIGNDAGPEKPFPIVFSGKVAAAMAGQQFLFPMINLTNVPEEILLRLGGVYIAWVTIEHSNKSAGAWREALVTVSPSPHAVVKVVARKTVTVHIIHESISDTPIDTKLEVMIMAYLRPALRGPYHPNPAPQSDIVANAEVAVASLSRERWRPETTLHTLSDERAQKTVVDRYVGLRSRVQRHIDAIPVHMVGVRTDRGEARDEAYGRGGFYIQR